MESLQNYYQFRESFYSWEEEFKKGFETTFNSDEILSKKEDEELNIYLIDENVLLKSDSILKEFVEIENKITQISELSDIEVVNLIMKLERINQNNVSKQKKVKCLMLEKKLIDIYKERILLKINMINSSSNNINEKDNDTKNSNNIDLNIDLNEINNIREENEKSSKILEYNNKFNNKSINKSNYIFKSIHSNDNSNNNCSSNNLISDSHNIKKNNFNCKKIFMIKYEKKE